MSFGTHVAVRKELGGVSEDDIGDVDHGPGIEVRTQFVVHSRNDTHDRGSIQGIDGVCVVGFCGSCVGNRNSS